MQTLINHGYQSFITKVANSRKKTPEQINEIAQGRVWSGMQAKERGLVDELGMLQDVVAVAAKKAGMAEYRVHYVEEKPSGFAAFVQQLTGASVRHIANLVESESMIAQFAPAITERAARDAELFRSAIDKPFSTYAHCLCEIE